MPFAIILVLWLRSRLSLPTNGILQKNKGYIYFNRDFLNFTGKNPSDITDNDFKNYLLYLAEEKQSATATLNQAINALKFYQDNPDARIFCWIKGWGSCKIKVGGIL